MSEHWHVLGPGAMGCLWAQALAAQIEASRASGRVTLIGRSNDQHNAVTLRKTDAQGTEQIALAYQDSNHPEPIANLLVTTKAYDAARAFASVLPRLHADAQIVLLHNGIQVQEQLAASYAHMALFALVTAQGAFMQAPWHLVHAGDGDSYLGPLTAVARAHARPQLPLNTQWRDDIHQCLIEKLAINAVINPLTVVLQCPNGVLMAAAHWQQVMALAAEVSLVIQALGYELSAPLKLLVAQVAERTAANYSSSYQDVYHGRRTELRFFTGYLLEAGQRLGLALPIQYQLAQALEAMGIAVRSN